MDAPRPDSARRFTDRVADYARFRPGYPEAIFDALVAAARLGAGSAVADVGSGTGISAAPLLERGCVVFGVEPNAAMRAAAEAAFAGYPGFLSVDGAAEATGLSDHSVDLVLAAQAFHWFDPRRARAEWRRILKAGAPAALLWNERRAEDSPFARGYEALLREYGTDYAAVRHENIGEEALAEFFGGHFEKRAFPHTQDFDFEGLRGRLRSASYAPAAGHPAHAPMLEALRRLFDACQEGGRIRMTYDAKLYLGTLENSANTARRG